MIRAALTLAFTGLALAACQRPAPGSAAPSKTEAPDTTRRLATQDIGAPNGPALAVSSAAFANGTAIPDKYAQAGADVSPPLSWTPMPSARAWAVIVEDPDAPSPRPFVHWVTWNIPSGAGGIAEGAKAAAPRIDGRNGAGSTGWKGPKPPAGDAPHHYHFQVFALDAEVAPAGQDRDALVAALKGHVIAQGDLIGLYQTK